MKSRTRKAPARTRKKQIVQPKPRVLAEMDHLDWDAHIHDPPYDAEGTITVRLVYAGESAPIPVVDPHED